MLSETAEKALAYYGGAELWKNSKYIEAIVSVTGLAFTLKRRPFFDHASLVMEIAKPFSKLTPIGRDKHITGVLDGDRVRLEDSAGKIIAQRENARSYFPFGRRLFYWDDLDMAYFANYAFWNYFTFPNLLMNESIAWTEKAKGILQARFPDSIPTHNQIQTFLIDMPSGRLSRHNYTADIISKLATVANVPTAHAEIDGLKYVSSRLVTPCKKDGSPLKRPVMIDIKLHSLRLTNDEVTV